MRRTWIAELNEIFVEVMRRDGRLEIVEEWLGEVFGENGHWRAVSHDSPNCFIWSVYEPRRVDIEITHYAMQLHDSDLYALLAETARQFDEHPTAGRFVVSTNGVFALERARVLDGRRMDLES